MSRILNSRRAVLALTGVLSILALGLVLKLDVSMSIATIVMSICGANAAQGIFKGEKHEISNKESK